MKTFTTKGHYHRLLPPQILAQPVARGARVWPFSPCPDMRTSLHTRVQKYHVFFFFFFKKSKITQCDYLANCILRKTVMGTPPSQYIGSNALSLAAMTWSITQMHHQPLLMGMQVLPSHPLGQTEQGKRPCTHSWNPFLSVPRAGTYPVS